MLVFILLEFNTIFGSRAKRIRHNKYNVCRLLICLFANGSNLVLIYNYVHTILLSDQAAQNISTLTAAGFKLVVFVSFSFSDSEILTIRNCSIIIDW